MRILELLREGERNVGDLQAALELDSSGTSQHLAALRQVMTAYGITDPTAGLADGRFESGPPRHVRSSRAAAADGGSE